MNVHSTGKNFFRYSYMRSIDETDCKLYIQGVSQLLKQSGSF